MYKYLLVHYLFSPLVTIFQFKSNYSSSLSFPLQLNAPSAYFDIKVSALRYKFETNSTKSTIKNIPNLIGWILGPLPFLISINNLRNSRTDVVALPRHL